MSFSGDLEHLPLTDVIQLLQQTGKSGTLRLRGAKGECQLGFRDGFIVSANHVNTGFRIGSILIELGIITGEALETTLAEQALRGPNPPPLIALLVETGRVKREEAFRGLQTLIELTIVEVLTWPRGKFELDVDQILVSDEYRYFPDHNEPPPQVSTQSFLMEALRIFDERKRDGTLKVEDFEGGEAGAADETISADDLGLGDVESLRRQTPIAPTADEELSADESHRHAIRREIDDLPAEDQEKLVSFLLRIGAPPPLVDGHVAAADFPLAVILFTRDQLFSHTVMTSCAVRNVFVFATDEPQDLRHIVEQSLARDLTPLLVLDAPGADPGVFSEEGTNEVMRGIRDAYPALRFIRLVDPGQSDLALRALTAGALNALVKPTRSSHASAFADGFIGFSAAFLACLERAGSLSAGLRLGDFRERLAGLASLAKPAEISLSLLQFVASIFPRALTLIVSGQEVVVERTIGLGGSRAVAPALKHRVPFDRPSVFASVVDGGLLFYGQAPEEATLKRLYRQIGEPHSPKIAVLPLKTHTGKVLALTYADFDAQWATPAPIELLDIFARHAGLVLDNLAHQSRA